ncbi:50S ribosomal protein L6 [Ktedonobacter sp. SOSP1-85]|uniref:Large ribosomal subunit protein uL6 n=1 Tax=Ktedonobacter robiniae TaxID=2778365 RepID=A0ABQ3UMQ7_9CHLR|nr:MULTISPECIES: 50S ribosomal protein L6 [Ktedonobacter]GHO53665.1 50S ribosomal protein L6 [Ktedonobacter robiniae]GHO68873.1 50S ribosomal protein L6 [Ktedonobacter sp. SOSP1-52]GHO74733.1 50S ribosomal protein L6 [Ktedonobacter sp. SOSP1-85]
MSRIGRAPITVPQAVQVNWTEDNLVTVKGPKGTLSEQVDPQLQLKLEDGTLTVTRPSDSKEHRSKHGLYRTLINNMVVGVTTGYTKMLEIHGVGYRAVQQGKNLIILVGYSHPVEVQAPQGIELKLEAPDPASKATRISVTGIDKHAVGQLAANIRHIRKPEPYKGKGIRYAGEAVRRKAGKAGKVGGKKK